MKRQLFSNSKNLWSNPFSVAAFIFFILLFFSCEKQHQPYKMLEFSGIENTTNFSKTWLVFNPDSTGNTVLLGNEGDLLMNDDFHFFIYPEGEQTHFTCNKEGDILYVNGKIQTITVPGDESRLPFFETLPEKNLSELQFIHFTDTFIPEVYYPYLTKLATKKSDVGIYVEYEVIDLEWIFTYFKPRFFIAEFVNENDFNIPSGLTNLELLWIANGTTVENFTLPALSGLKTLFLENDDLNRRLNGEFLSNNPQIEKIFLTESGVLDMAVLSPLKNLKELIFHGDSIINPEMINEHNRLEVLSLTGDNLNFNAGLIKLPSLKWMAFNSNVMQEEFNAFLEAHPKLKIVEIVENYNINNLQALTRLKHLYGLTVTDTVADISSIQQLHHLKYLSLPSDFLEVSENTAGLHQAVSGARIVANEGFLCLGSGWLLLLVPLVIIFSLFFRAKKSIIPKS